jgi:hypothetical protein
MKISVITLHTVNNYGSVLQTYATQQVLEELGCEVEFVDYCRKVNTDAAAIEKILQSQTAQRFKGIWDANSLTRKMIKIPVSLMLARKSAPMKKFIRERIHLTPRSYFSFEELLEDTPTADVYMTGSDQVWNSIWNKGIEKPYFLEYAPMGKRRVSFAASFGKTSLDDDEIAPTRSMLMKYSHISVREQSGVTLLQSIGIPSVQVLDPTLMLTVDQWKTIAQPCKESFPFLLVYQLDNNPLMDRYAEELAKRKKWQILRISYGYSGRQKFGRYPSVERLLGLFAGSECVLTDSFHATAYALNFSKNFISVLPNRFGTRIESILELTKTNNHLLKSFDDFSVVDNPIDWNSVCTKLNNERQRGMMFLKNAIYE